MSRIVYLTRNYKSTGHGGGKARVDVEDILSRMGAVNLGLNRTFHSSKIVDFTMTLSGVMKFLAGVGKGDVVVLQYPVKKYYKLICRVARMKGAHTITLIHDLGSFRRRKLTVDEEIRKLALTDVIIAANTHMIEWLREQGCEVPMTDQVVWDYLSSSKPSGHIYPANSCVFVGDLHPDKNGYLYRLPPSLHIDLYGTGCPSDIPDNIVNHGFTEADDIISGCEGRWGLLWYGTGLVHDEKEFIGEYIRYCNPHKLALYMRARKPVIIWQHAADAGFVRDNGIGITVDSLENLDRRLASITEDEYREMLSNVDRVAGEMARGHYIESAVNRAVELIKTT